MKPHLLETRNLSVTFGGLEALKGVDLRVEEGSVFGIIGPNGAGKTTLFNAISGFLAPNRGSIYFESEEITGREVHDIAQKGIVRTFQITSVFPNLSVEDNIIAGGYLHSRKDGLRTIMAGLWESSADSENRGRAREIANVLGLDHVLSARAGNLSFGDQHRLEIAIALAARPRLLLLDEPAAGMSPEESKQLVRLVGSIRAGGITVIVVEHNMKVIADACDEVAVLNYGKKIAEGEPGVVLASDEVRRVYLGQNGNEYA